jgi:hypothetical protein
MKVLSLLLFLGSTVCLAATPENNGPLRPLPSFPVDQPGQLKIFRDITAVKPFPGRF